MQDMCSTYCAIILVQVRDSHSDTFISFLFSLHFFSWEVWWNSDVSTFVCYTFLLSLTAFNNLCLEHSIALFLYILMLVTLSLYNLVFWNFMFLFIQFLLKVREMKFLWTCSILSISFSIQGYDICHLIFPFKYKFS